MSKKPTVIIVEGMQGVGKGTVTNLLRENIPYSTLMRLSGIADKSKETGVEKVFQLRMSELDFIKANANSETTFILDRCHLSEKVYCNLGYKEYDFQQQTNILNEKLNELTELFNVYIIVLALEDNAEEILKERLQRDKADFPHSKFNVENSLRQQTEYINEAFKIWQDYSNIKTGIVYNHKDAKQVCEEIMRIANIWEDRQ